MSLIWKFKLCESSFPALVSARLVSRIRRGKSVQENIHINSSLTRNFLHMTLLYCFYVAVSVIWWSTWWKRLISLIRDFAGRLLMGSIITSYLKKSFPVFLDLMIICSLTCMSYLAQLINAIQSQYALLHKFSQYCSLRFVHSENFQWRACWSDISICVVWTK